MLDGALDSRKTDLAEPLANLIVGGKPIAGMGDQSAMVEFERGPG